MWRCGGLAQLFGGHPDDPRILAKTPDDRGDGARGAVDCLKQARGGWRTPCRSIACLATDGEERSTRGPEASQLPEEPLPQVEVFYAPPSSRSHSGTSVLPRGSRPQRKESRSSSQTPEQGGGRRGRIQKAVIDSALELVASGAFTFACRPGFPLASQAEGTMVLDISEGGRSCLTEEEDDQEGNITRTPQHGGMAERSPDLRCTEEERPMMNREQNSSSEGGETPHMAKAEGCPTEGSQLRDSAEGEGKEPQQAAAHALCQGGGERCGSRVLHPLNSHEEKKEEEEEGKGASPQASPLPFFSQETKAGLGDKSPGQEKNSRSQTYKHSTKEVAEDITAHRVGMKWTREDRFLDGEQLYTRGIVRARIASFQATIEALNQAAQQR